MKDAQAFLRNNWKWGNLSERQETLSGSGSTMANTQNIRRELPLLVNKWDIHSIFDAPCGDGNWMSKTEFINYKDISYCGGDLVDSFVAQAKLKGLNVYNFDIRINPFPPVDLWLCRACWYHLPFADITATVNNWLNSSIKYALVTSHLHNGETHDINPGEFRRLELREHDYFGMGAPIDGFIDVERLDLDHGYMVEEMLLFRNPNVK